MLIYKYSGNRKAESEKHSTLSQVHVILHQNYQDYQVWECFTEQQALKNCKN
jgi:hypothetical protein